MSLISFTISTPQESKTVQVEWIEVESPSGTFFVGYDHAPLASLVKHKSAVLYKQPSQAEPTAFTAQQGIFYITKNQAVLIVDQ